MNRNWTRRILTGVTLLLTLPSFAGISYGDEIDPSAISPAELHQELAKGKRTALARRRAVVEPAAVMFTTNYDAVYYRLNLGITGGVYGETGLDGEVSMRARSRSVGFSVPTLNLVNELTVLSVTSFGRPVAWTHASGFLYVTLDSLYNVDEEFEVTVKYEGYPPAGGFQGFVYTTRLGAIVISTLSEPYLAQSWWPCKDTPSDKADSVDVIVTVDDNLYCVSNGVLRDSVNNGDGSTTYSWHEGYPITTYLVSLAITNYSRFDRWYHYGLGDADSMPVRFYSYPDKLSSAVATWPIAVDQIDFYSETFGEYPFVEEKYGMAHFTWSGAMEHQTVTSATSTSFGFSTYLIAHELAHQWWGDMITCRNWHHIWLNEGFASYCEALWAEHAGGVSAYKSYMNGMTYTAGGTVYVDDTTDVDAIFDIRVYDKGAWVVHMLRGVVGDEAFFDILRAYYADPDHQHKDAVTEEFRDIASAVSGMDLTQFFADWVYGTYYPRYACSFLAEQRADNAYDVFVHLRQYQSSNPQVFDLPVDLRMNGVSGTPIYTVMNNKREQDFVLVLPSPPSSITVDPDNWILDASISEAYDMNLVTEALAGGTQYMPYSDSLIAKAGTAPYHFSVVLGALPDGLTLNPSSGVVNGIPLEAGSDDLTIGLWDDGFINYQEKIISLEIEALAYMPGDQNGDLFLDALDLASLIDHLFAGTPPPPQVNATDLNGDCQSDALDLAYLIDHLFAGAARPVPGCIG